MSYSVTGVAAISFPIQTLPNDAYSVAGGHQALTPIAPDTQKNVELSGSSKTPVKFASPLTKVVDAKHASHVDTVTLSTSQKVLKLQQEGESALQIAAKLSLPTKEVLRDLHVDTHVAQSFTVAPVTAPLSGNTTATVSAPTVGA